MSRRRLSGSDKGALLVFDGDCGFCTTSVEWLRKKLPAFPPAEPWQWCDLDSMGLTTSDVTRYAWVITRQHQYAGHLAFSALLRMQPSAMLRAAGHLMRIPPFSWVAAGGYHYVAKYRHVLPGGTPACQLPAG